MTTHEELPTTRAGSSADISRRVERLEAEVSSLTVTVARIEQNQAHTAELNKLRFDALDMGVKSLGGQLTDFIKRIDGMISGEVDTAQSRQGRELVASYQKWREEVDDDLAILKNQNVRQAGLNAGVVQTFGTGKAVVITAAAVITAIFTVLGELHLI